MLSPLCGHRLPEKLTLYGIWVVKSQFHEVVEQAVLRDVALWLILILPKERDIVTEVLGKFDVVKFLNVVLELPENPIVMEKFPNCCIISALVIDNSIYVK